MKRIATLTMNPAIDVAYETDRVFHTHKIRARQEHYDPGGGGINVARVIARLGGTARAHYLAGGATGTAFDALLDLHQMVRSKISIAGNTRVSTSVYEKATGKEFRFVPQGPTVTSPEWQSALEHLETIQCDFLVASGSLPDGVPDDFYARVQSIGVKCGFEVIIDSSGSALKKGLQGGGILLVKPSLGELEQLFDQTFASQGEIAAAANQIVKYGWARLVAVTMGHKGAIFAQETGAIHLPAVSIKAQSAVGAGDSFLAAMVYALAFDWEPLDAFRYGIAAGTAAVLTPGTDLCHKVDVDRMFALVGQA